jgi:aspartyl-tRNA(Asn)/glutamyl-tRNA(Gln) amidotransferase subunit A
MSAPRFPDWVELSPEARATHRRRCVARSETIGRKLNAIAALYSDAPSSPGPLAGLPYFAKDMIATGRSAPSWGCARPVTEVGEPAPLIAQLAAAGASLIGSAEMTELAYEPSGMNAARGRVINPWHRDAVTGGSSSGSAALVASGCCFMALGSDTGGSVRLPAHCCGITALKPTHGAIPADGTMPLAPSLDTIGILTRSAADLAAVWRAAFASSDAASAITGVTLLTEANDAADPEIRAAMDAALAVFRALGLSVSARVGFPEQADRNALTVMQAEAARAHHAVLDDSRVDPVLRKRLGKGLTITDEALAAALAERDTLRTQFLADYLPGNGVAVLPVMPILTPLAAETDPASPQFSAKTLYAMSRFTRFVNYLQLPALALPIGFDRRGLPMALQLIGPPHGEAALLALGERFQSQTGWHGRVPADIAARIADEPDLAA